MRNDVYKRVILVLITVCTPLAYNSTVNLDYGALWLIIFPFICIVFFYIFNRRTLENNRKKIDKLVISFRNGSTITFHGSKNTKFKGVQMIFKDKDFIERCIVRLGAILEVNEDLDNFDREHIEQAREMLSRVVGMDLSEEDESSD